MARILTIDDDAAIRTLLSLQLADRGHTVLEADSGDSGLALARAERPDVVLLDLGLPGMHGTRVLEGLKGDPDTAEIPVIVISAWGEGHVAKVGLARGAFGVLRKPFSANPLYELIDGAIAARRAGARRT